MDGVGEFTLEAGTLTPGQSKQFASSLKAARTGEFVNQVTASARGGLKAEATATTFVRRPVLTLSKTGPARQYFGRPVIYEITVTNKGDAPAANAVVEDTLPPGAQAVRMSETGDVTASKVAWSLGTLAPNASKTVGIAYIPAEAGILTQAATASAVGAEPVTATAETTIAGLAAVHVEVIDVNDPVPVGGQTAYLITVINQGSSPCHKVQITATVENAEEIVAATGPTPVAIKGDQAKSAALDTLAPGAKVTWQVIVKALKAGDVRFRVTMTTAELTRPVEVTEATELYE